MPRTEAGKRLDDLLRPWWPGTETMPGQIPDAIDAIETEAYALGHADGKVPWPSRAEAVAAERARIRDAVKRENFGAMWVSRAAVLAIINERATPAAEGTHNVERRDQIIEER